MAPISPFLFSILLVSLWSRSQAENLTSQVPLQTLYDEAYQATLFGAGSIVLDRTPSTPGTCPEACKLLTAIRPGSVLTKDTASFERARHGYWTKNQAESSPQCIFQPERTGDVSLAIVVSRFMGCPFAVKSGGHGCYVGQSSVNQGMTIDLVKLNLIEVSEDRRIVKLGPGSRWLDVYTSLEPLNLTVIGGRDADVGVGGFLLGGGISFHSSEYGWGCDNIASYEVVLSNGTIVIASEGQNNELYKALRGGGSNFGIVTAFHLDAYPHEIMWGGARTYKYSEKSGVLRAFMNHASLVEKDPKASVIVNLIYQNDEWVFLLDLEYSAPVLDAVCMREFIEIPAIGDDTAIANQSQLTIGMAQRAPRGYRSSFWASTVKADSRILHFYVQTFVAESQKTLKHPGITPAGDIQVIPPGQRRPMTKRGGNVFGLADNPEETLLLFNPVFLWDDPAHDDVVYATIWRILEKTREESIRLGLESAFIYMNYASQYQHVIGSYGKNSEEFLHKVAQKYDPNGVFQHLMIGGHKLYETRQRDLSKIKV